MSISVGVYDAKTQFTQLLHAVEAGETVIITRHGKPVAQLGPIRMHGLGRLDPLDAFRRMDKLREGTVKITREEIKASVEEGRP